MQLDKHVFAIDAPACAARLTAFIDERRRALFRDGIIVPFSGGLDSSTVLLLCLQAAGPDRVTALLLPERQGNPEAASYARLVADQFKIKTITRDISAILAALGTYDFLVAKLPLRGMQDWAARSYLQVTGDRPFMQIVHGQASPLERAGFARYNSKHRIRAVVTYLMAKEANALVVGCAHKTEDLLGLFVKFGVDDCADVMPLKNLYRTQIVQLAEHLGVPPEILARTPNPDIIPGVSDKYQDILGLRSDILDLILYGLEHGLDTAAIAGQLDLPGEKVEQIRALVRLTEHMRHPSQSIGGLAQRGQRLEAPSPRTAQGANRPGSTVRRSQAMAAGS